MNQLASRRIAGTIDASRVQEGFAHLLDDHNWTLELCCDPELEARRLVAVIRKPKARFTPVSHRSGSGMGVRRQLLACEKDSRIDPAHSVCNE